MDLLNNTISQPVFHTIIDWLEQCPPVVPYLRWQLYLPTWYIQFFLFAFYSIFYFEAFKSFVYVDWNTFMIPLAVLLRMMGIIFATTYYTCITVAYYQLETDLFIDTWKLTFIDLFAISSSNLLIVASLNAIVRNLQHNFTYIYVNFWLETFLYTFYSIISLAIYIFLNALDLNILNSQQSSAVAFAAKYYGIESVIIALLGLINTTRLIWINRYHIQGGSEKLISLTKNLVLLFFFTLLDGGLSIMDGFLGNSPEDLFLSTISVYKALPRCFATIYFLEIIFVRSGSIIKSISSTRNRNSKRKRTQTTSTSSDMPQINHNNSG